MHVRVCMCVYVCLLKNNNCLSQSVVILYVGVNLSLSLSLSSAFGEYNTEQFTPVKIDKEQVNNLLLLH